MAKHFSAKENNLMHFFWGGGAFVSPLIMGQLMVTHSWRVGYFVISGILALVAIILVISIYRKIWIDDDAVTLESATATAEANSRIYLEKPQHQTIQVAAFFFLGGTDYTLVFFTGAVLLRRGASLESVLLLSAAYYLAMTLARLVAGAAARWLTEMQILRVALAVAAIGIAVLFFTGNRGLVFGADIAIIGMFVTGFGLGPLLPTLVSDTSNWFRPNILPKIVGYELAAFGAGIAALFFLTSQIMHFTQNYELLFLLALIFVALVFLCNELLNRDYRRLNRRAYGLSPVSNSKRT
jgi:MFS family permease